MENCNKTWTNQMENSELVVKDSYGKVLQTGDTVMLTKDLKVKGSSVNLKQGTVIKKIRLTDSTEEVDCKVDGMNIVLRTEFLKKK
ncbi:MAG: zinc ribbon domain-containing protein YjdM [Candidatus Kapabacteria bacterium]|nr:zinc ribbon domain-containing protein YjdM [Candidatus Kapabacteria bacterium]